MSAQKKDQLSANNAAAGFSAAVLHKIKHKRDTLCCAKNDSSSDFFTSSSDTQFTKNAQQRRDKKDDQIPVFVKAFSTKRSPAQEAGSKPKFAEINDLWSGEQQDFRMEVADRGLSSGSGSFLSDEQLISTSNADSSQVAIKRHKQNDTQKPLLRQNNHLWKHLLTDSSNVSAVAEDTETSESEGEQINRRIVRKYRIQYNKTLHHGLAGCVGRLRSIVNKSGCAIRLHDTLLLRRTSSYGGLIKYLLFSLEGKTKQQIDVCLKLLEKFHPVFLERKECKLEPRTVILWNYRVPENTHLCLSSQRFLCQSNYFGGMKIRKN